MFNGNIVVIGVSTGGPITLKTLFSTLPRLEAAVIVVLHIQPGMDERVALSLAKVSVMPVSLAKDGEYLRTGHVYLAPGGCHLALEGNRRIMLVSGPRVNYVQPSADVTMKSLQRSRSNVFVGIVLTGMGNDGAEGIRHIKSIGGITIAQDRETSSVYGMPRSAIATGAVDYVLPDVKMGKLIERLVNGE